MIPNEMQAQAQERIGRVLRETFADFVQQPLRPSLLNLAGEIRASLETDANDSRRVE